MKAAALERLRAAVERLEAADLTPAPEDHVDRALRSAVAGVLAELDELIADMEARDARD